MTYSLPVRECKKRRTNYKEICENFDEAEENHPSIKHNKKKLYDIEIVDRDIETKRVKAHYVGYSNKFDAWLDYEESCPIAKFNKLTPLTEVSHDERLVAFFEETRLRIKKRLVAHRLDDPHGSVEISGQEDLYTDLLSCCVKRYCRGKEFWFPHNLTDFDIFLGSKWHERIVNSSGDFAYIQESTLRVSIQKRPPLKEYMYQGGAYVEVANEQLPALVFRFSIGRGNKMIYEEKEKDQQE